jgi:hypothetical protein
MTLRVTRWLHLEDVCGDQWIKRVWTAADAAAKARKVQLRADEFGDLGLHISTRLDIISRITQRIELETSELYKAVKKHGPKHVFIEGKPGRAFPVNNDLKYLLIADIDALLFEVNSCWELMRKLFYLVRAHVGCPIVGKVTDKKVTDELKAVLGSSSAGWFRWLVIQRNFVAHKGAPYLAIDVTDGPELLVMKKNLTTFVDPNTFFWFSEIVEVARGFNGVKKALQAHLIGLFGQSSTP